MVDTLLVEVDRDEGVTMVLFWCVYVAYSTGVAEVVGEFGKTYTASVDVT